MIPLITVLKLIIRRLYKLILRAIHLCKCLNETRLFEDKIVFNNIKLFNLTCKRKLD